MEASTQQSGLQCSGWTAMENEKDTTLTAITLGSKYFSYVRSPAPSHTQTLSKPFWTLAIKWEVNIFIKKSSCVCYSLRQYVSSIYMYISAWICRWQYNNKTLTGTTTLGQSEPGSNGNEGVLHITQISRTRASPSDYLVSYPWHLFGVGVLSICRGGSQFILLY